MEGARGDDLRGARVRRPRGRHAAHLAHLDGPGSRGKTTARTDTYRGRFVRLVPDELVVEIDVFETDDPALQGEMTSTITLADADGGTELTAVHDGVPDGIAAADNELGWRMALDRLAALVERAP